MQYELNWIGKSYAKTLVSNQTDKVLVPDDKHNSETINSHSDNIFIEGDNLDALKILQSSYTGKVKMIYIDPPYNTGSKFIYSDKFTWTTDELSKALNVTHTEAKQIIKNTSRPHLSHSAWLTFMYPRLCLARDLLTDDGVIFISIDDNEQAQLKLLCDEVFGEENFRNSFVTRRHDKNLNRQFIEAGLKTLNVGFETILVYSKSSNFNFSAVFKATSEKRSNFGYWKGFWNSADRPTMRYPLLGVLPLDGQWKWKESIAQEAVENYIEYEEKFANSMTLEEYWERTGKNKKFIRRNENGKGKNLGVDHWIEPSDGILRNTNLLDILVTASTAEIKDIFDFPKNPELIKILLKMASSENDVILDFFAGSSTTAHAVMQLNAEDNGNRRFICVQLPEQTDEKSEAFKAGFKNIAEISKERIRRAGKQILSTENQPIDVGFKVFEIKDN